MTGRGTNTYVLGRGEVVVIDPGPSDDGHLAAIEKAVGARGKASVVVLTHHHVDHAESGERISRVLGAPLAAAPHPEAPRLDRALADGDFVAPGLRALATPGHCPDHLCLLWEAERAVFAGDLVAGEGYIVISPPEGDMTAYLDSLRAVGGSALFGAGGGARVILPGHGPAIEDPAAYLDGYVAHRLAREAKVLQALTPGTARTLDELLPLVYDDTPETMWPIAAHSLRAHLEKLVREGRAVEVGPGYSLPG